MNAAIAARGRRHGNSAGLVAAILIGCLVLAGCSSSDDDGGGSDGDEGRDDANSSAAPPDEDSALWITFADENKLVKADPESGEVLATIKTDEYPTDVLVAFDSVWVANASGGTVQRIDPQSGEVLSTIETGDARGMAATEDTLWVSHIYDEKLIPIDPETDEVGDPIEFGDNTSPKLLAVSGDRILAEESYAGGTISVDPDSGEFVADTDSGSSTDLAVLGDRVFSAAFALGEADTDAVVELDVETGAALEEYDSEERPWTVAPDESGDALWVGFQTTPGTVAKLDLESGEYSGTAIETGDSMIGDSAVVGDRLWVVDEGGMLWPIDTGDEAAGDPVEVGAQGTVRMVFG